MEANDKATTPPLDDPRVLAAFQRGVQRAVHGYEFEWSQTTVLSVTTFWSFLREFSPLSRARF